MIDRRLPQRSARVPANGSSAMRGSAPRSRVSEKSVAERVFSYTQMPIAKLAVWLPISDMD
jgi:hypothetical protein